MRPFGAHFSFGLPQQTLQQITHPTLDKRRIVEGFLCQKKDNAIEGKLLGEL